MAIAFDSSSNITSDTSNTTTFSHTCSGSDRILFVTASSLNNGTADAVTGVTYAGVSMTKLFGPVAVGGVSWVTYLYYIVNPTSGANNVVISRNTSNGEGYGSAVSYTGVDQVSPIDASTTGTGTGSPITTTLSSVTDNCWFVLANWNPDANPTASTNSTTRVNNGFPGALFDFGPKTPAGSLNMQQTFAGTRAWLSYMVAFKPSVAVTNLASVDGVARANISSVMGVASANISSVDGVTD